MHHAPLKNVINHMAVITRTFVVVFMILWPSFLLASESPLSIRAVLSEAKKAIAFSRHKHIFSANGVESCDQAVALLTESKDLGPQGISVDLFFSGAGFPDYTLQTRGAENVVLYIYLNGGTMEDLKVKDIITYYYVQFEKGTLSSVTFNNGNSADLTNLISSGEWKPFVKNNGPVP